MEFECKEDHVAPEEILEAAKEGKLQLLNLYSGWVDVPIPFNGVAKGVKYRIKPLQ